MTQVVTSDGLAGLLGASPGASTAVQVALDVPRSPENRWFHIVSHAFGAVPALQSRGPSPLLLGAPAAVVAATERDDPELWATALGVP